jgi:hypothetical protein
VNKVRQLIGSDTEAWYLSRFIWLGSAQILWGIYRGEFEWIATGIATIRMRFTTKKEIFIRKK